MKCSIFLLFVSISTQAYSPKLTATGGAAKIGNADEALFGNPADLAKLQAISSFAYYTRSRTSDWNSGGKALVMGVYDISSEVAHAGISYLKEDRSRLVDGTHLDADRKEIKLGLGRDLSPGLGFGVAGYYVTRTNNKKESKFGNVDAGITYKAYSDLELGVDYENIAFRDERESPPNVNLSAQYVLGDATSAYGNFSRITKGSKMGKNSWATGITVQVLSDFTLAGGMYLDRITGNRGKSFGVAWAGPRTVFSYSLNLTKGAPVQRDQVFGLSLSF